MADAKQAKPEPVRLVVRVHIPSVDPNVVGELHAAVKEAVKPYAGAEIELSVLPIVRTM